ncbi:hypothetical protein T01_6624 [Trichinella spiralis]|uniref:Uncharacterized protein n=1 Tax=Trichinella spiralis TaxID=6334 RepID=A0A0V1ATE6_TRISP|nr:hypothetical protein T01_16143 [Trichinella spiralis]KRY28056.1 hypothetical protein T01_6624 [Trichinella spiralis]
MRSRAADRRHVPEFPLQTPKEYINDLADTFKEVSEKLQAVLRRQIKWFNSRKNDPAGYTKEGYLGQNVREYIPHSAASWPEYNKETPKKLMIHTDRLNACMGQTTRWGGQPTRTKAIARARVKLIKENSSHSKMAEGICHGSLTNSLRQTALKRQGGDVTSDKYSGYQRQDNKAHRRT